MSSWFPLVRTGHDTGGAVFDGEVGERPDGAELCFDREGDSTAPDLAVLVKTLFALAGTDAGELGEVELVAVGMGSEERLAGLVELRVKGERVA